MLRRNCLNAASKSGAGAPKFAIGRHAVIFASVLDGDPYRVPFVVIFVAAVTFQ